MNAVLVDCVSYHPLSITAYEANASAFWNYEEPLLPMPWKNEEEKTDFARKIWLWIMNE